MTKADELRAEIEALRAEEKAIVSGEARLAKARVKQAAREADLAWPSPLPARARRPARSAIPGVEVPIDAMWFR